MICNLVCLGDFCRGRLTKTSKRENPACEICIFGFVSKLQTKTHPSQFPVLYVRESPQIWRRQNCVLSALLPLDRFEVKGPVAGEGGTLILHTVHCTLYSVHCKVLTVHCVQRAVYCGNLAIRWFKGRSM